MTTTGGGTVFPRAAALFLCAVLLAACASRPLDIPAEEWEHLNADQRALAYSLQEELDAGPSMTEPPDAEASRTARVERRRARGRFGDSLTCDVGPGLGETGPGWRPFDVKTVTIVRGEVARLLETPPLWGHYADSGLSLRLCAVDPRHAPPEGCTVVAGGFRALSNGMEWRVFLPDTLEAPLRCAFTPGAPVAVEHQ